MRCQHKKRSCKKQIVQGRLKLRTFMPCRECGPLSSLLGFGCGGVALVLVKTSLFKPRCIKPFIATAGHDLSSGTPSETTRLPLPKRRFPGFAFRVTKALLHKKTKIPALVPFQGR
jgi:hypothetical protein